jgi:hypothetical protein
MCRNRFLSDYSGRSKCALGEKAKWRAGADLVGLRDAAGSHLFDCFPGGRVGTRYEHLDGRPCDSVSRRIVNLVDVFHAQSAKSRINSVHNHLS